MQDLFERSIIEFLDRSEARPGAPFTAAEAALAHEILAAIHSADADHARNLFQWFPSPEEAKIGYRFVRWLKTARANANLRHVADMVMKFLDE